MESYEKLLEGYREFRSEYLGKPFDAYRKWAARQQKPDVMIISCSDSRINPAILTHAGLGEIFMVNNVANIVPPYKEGKNTHHSTSSAIEYAVNHLKMKHLIIMGHSNCGGINALFHQKKEVDSEAKEYSFIEPWINIASGARDHVKKEMSDLSVEEQLCACEKKSILISLKNLKSFPFVKRAVEQNNLKLYGWYFDIAEATLYAYNEDVLEFEAII